MKASFELYDIKEPQTKSNYLFEITYGLQKFSIDLTRFMYKSKVVLNKSNEFNNLPKEKRITATTSYLKDIIEKADSLLNIEKKNYAIFLLIISGQSAYISNDNLFDLFKLSKFFGITNLLNFIKAFCGKVNQIKDVIKIMKKGNSKYNISKEEEEYFNEFIDFGKFGDILVENIQYCFNDYSFKDNFPHSTLFKLLQKCESQDEIPSKDLYDMISKSLDKDLHFLPYINVSQLFEYERKNLFQSIFDIEKKLQPPKEETQETIETPNDTIEQAKLSQSQKQLNLKLSNSSSSNKVGKNTTSTDFSSVPLKQSYSPNRNQFSTNNADNIQNISKTQKPTAKIIVSDKKDDKTANNQSNPTNPKESQSDYTESDISSDDQSNQQDSDKPPPSKITPDSHSDKLPQSKTIPDSHTQTKPDSYSSKPLQSKTILDSHTQTKPDSHIQRTSSNKEYHPPTSQKNIQRISVFKENEKIVKLGYYNYGYFKNDISKDLESSLKHTVIVPDNDNLINQTVSKRIKDASLRKEKSSLYRKVEVTTESTFAAAIRCKNISRKVCVLNFASATQPGGGVLNGRNAQEEVLSRQSTLYFSLVQMKDFYEYNKRKKDPFGTDYMIYSPNVIIIRDDNDKLINLTVKVSVISSVAVNYAEILEKYKGQKMERQVYDTMRKRCRRILELCIKEGNDIIVLGAFGCGVFQNSPEMISRIFHKIIIDEGYGEMFTKIVFAIKIKHDQSTELIDAFKNAFKPHHADKQTAKPASGTGTRLSSGTSGTGARLPSGTSGTGTRLSSGTSGAGTRLSSGTSGAGTISTLPSSSSIYPPRSNH